MRVANIFRNELLAGILSETAEGYLFKYDEEYLRRSDAKSVSNSLPLTQLAYASNVLFPFFDGLIPEGWLLDLAQENWKLNRSDRFGLLLACCKNCIGAVSVLPVYSEGNEKL